LQRGKDRQRAGARSFNRSSLQQHIQRGFGFS
jgi:hypothetical protein